MVHLRQGTIHVGCCSSDPLFNIDLAFGNLVPCINNITIYIFWRWKDKTKIKEYCLSYHLWINYNVFLFSVTATSPQVDFLIPEKMNMNVSTNLQLLQVPWRLACDCCQRHHEEALYHTLELPVHWARGRNLLNTEKQKQLKNKQNSPNKLALGCIITQEILAKKKQSSKGWKQGNTKSHHNGDKKLDVVV